MQLALSYLACRMVGVPLEISLPAELHGWADFQRISGLSPTIETHSQLVQRLGTRRDGTIRAVGKRPEEVFAPSEIGNLYVYTGPSLANGRLELLAYLREQSVSEVIHRYGNIL